MKVAIIGDGGWGTANALLLTRNGHEVVLWGAFKDYVEEMKESRVNRKFLHEVRLRPFGKTTPV